jgi:RND family efflux transporter MFP subunit
MTRYRWLMPVGSIIALLLLLAIMAGYFDHKIQPGLDPQDTPDITAAVPVLVQQSSIAEPVPASIEAKETTVISSRLMARITSIAVRAGDLVEQGQLLLELEKRDLLAREQQAREQIQAVQARLEEAKQNLERANQLHQRGLIAVADRDAARATASTLEADLGSARQALEQAQVAVTFTEIRSPIPGRVVDRFAEPGDTASPGQKLLSLYNPFSLRVEAWVREQLALSLKIGQQLEVEIPSANSNLIASIEEIVPAADPGSRSFLVRAILPPDQGLLPGMYARLHVPAGTRTRLLVPVDRVAQVGQLDLVLVTHDGKVERRFVRLGQPTGDGMIEVITGLLPGDLVLPRLE